MNELVSYLSKTLTHNSKRIFQECFLRYTVDRYGCWFNALKQLLAAGEVSKLSAYVLYIDFLLFHKCVSVPAAIKSDCLVWINSAVVRARRSEDWSLLKKVRDRWIRQQIVCSTFVDYHKPNLPAPCPVCQKAFRLTYSPSQQAWVCRDACWVNDYSAILCRNHFDTTADLPPTSIQSQPL